jgi:multiple antibiotic resistance protein
MPDALAGFFSAVMLSLATLAPIINPPGAAPIFLSMTSGASEATRSRLASRVARNCCLLLLAAMAIGSYVLMFFGLSLATIRIAGGLLVIATAWRLLDAEHGAELKLLIAAEPSLDPLAARSFYPLTFPVTVGPGSISVAMTIGAGVRLDLAALPTEALGAVVGVVAVSGGVYFCYRFASRVLRVIGGTGTVVLLRLSAFILLAIGVQILCDGLAERFIGPAPGR